MKDNVSPEEKLLRLISGKKQDKKETKPVPKQSISSLTLKYLSSLNINKIIRVAFVAACVYLISSFIYPWIGLKKIRLPQVTQEKISEPKKELKEEIKPYEFYLEGTKGHQIFGAASGQEAARPASGVNVDLTKDINLVGILAGENPQAIIEDKKTQKTYYVTKGQFIGEFQVEDIQEGKVILNYQGQRFELYL